MGCSMRSRALLCVLLLASIFISGKAFAQNSVILVLPFQVNVQVAPDELARVIPDEVAGRLAAGGLMVVAPKDSWALVERQKVKQIDLGVARDLAAVAGASDAVYGSITQVGDGMSIDVRLVDASGLRPARPLFVQAANVKDLPKALDELSERIITELTQRSRVAEVKVRGLRVLDEDVVLLRLNHRKGDPVDAAQVNQEIKRIWDMGYFSDVQASVEQSGEGLVLVYTVVEKPRVENIVVEGSDEVSSDDVLAAMGTKVGSVLNEKILAQDLQRVADLYHKEGYYLAQINYRLEGRSGGGSTLVLTVAEGNKLYIKKIKIEGANELDEDDIKSELALGERRFWSWMTGSGVLKEDMLERDSQFITFYCMNHGFLDAAVAAPKIEYDPDGIVVTFSIKEGPRYKIGKVNFAGDLIDTDEVLYSVIAMDDRAAKSEYLAYDAMQNDSKALTEYYGNYGYAYADIGPHIERHDDAVADITYVINKRQKVYINRVLVDGNYKTRDNVIMRELRLTDGDLFMGAALNRSTERLNRLQFFEAVETELVPTDKPEEVDLKVTVKEGNTGSIMGGVGYSTYYQFGVTGTIMERNLFGRGYSASLRALFSGKENSYVFNFTNPRVYDTLWAAGFDLYLTDQEYDDFDKKTLGGIFRVGHPVGEYSDVTLGYRLDRYNISDVQPGAAKMIRDREGDNISSVALARFSRDTTDSRENPTKGNIFRLYMDYGGGILMGDDNFFKPVVEVHQYFQLMQDHVLHGRLKAGVVLETKSGEEVPVFERFYIGGMESLRGYKYSDISPRDPASDDTIGGDRMAVLNLEYIWTFQKELGLAIVPFFDVGFALDSKTYSNWDDEIKKSVGLELRWKSPLGALRFAYGYPLDDGRNGQKLNGRFEFSMGQFF